jgi:hypothetical protein
MKLGYARVSTEDQRLDIQRTRLTEAGCGKLFEEKISGAARQRPALGGQSVGCSPDNAKNERPRNKRGSTGVRQTVVGRSPPKVSGNHRLRRVSGHICCRTRRRTARSPRPEYGQVSLYVSFSG